MSRRRRNEALTEAGRVILCPQVPPLPARGRGWVDRSLSRPFMSESVLRILLVEDNAFDAQAVRMGLGKCVEEKFDLVHVERLDQALAQISSGAQFDLVLLDLGLPDAQGVQALRRVHDAAPDLAIVILSGLDRGETIFQAIEMGAQDYLVKSEIDSRMLRRAVHYAIERKCAELKLRADQERLRFAVETAKDAIILAESKGRILSWNRAAQELFG